MATYAGEFISNVWSRFCNGRVPSVSVRAQDAGRRQIRPMSPNDDGGAECAVIREIDARFRESRIDRANERPHLPQFVVMGAADRRNLELVIDAHNPISACERPPTRRTFRTNGCSTASRGTVRESHEEIDDIGYSSENTAPSDNCCPASFVGDDEWEALRRLANIRKAEHTITMRSRLRAHLEIDTTSGVGDGVVLCGREHDPDESIRCTREQLEEIISDIRSFSPVKSIARAIAGVGVKTGRPHKPTEDDTELERMVGLLGGRCGADPKDDDEADSTCPAADIEDWDPSSSMELEPGDN